MVPKIIHQTWKTAVVPEPMLGYRRTWLDRNPSWEHRFYTDADCLELVTQQFPSRLKAYTGFKTQIQRIDFFRYLVVYKYGGLYADLDMECLKGFDDFVGAEALFSIETRLSVAYQRRLGYLYPYQLANCIFAAEPGHWFLEGLIETVAANAGRAIARDADIEDGTGPRMLTRRFYSLPAGERRKLKVLAQPYWMAPTIYPNWWPVNKNMYARHHFLGTWKNRRTRAGFRQKWRERSLWPNPWEPLFHQFE